MIMVEFDRSHRTTSSHHFMHQPHGAPHLQHLDQHSPHSTPSPPYQYSPLPAMNPQRQPQGMRPTPTSYPSPSSYAPAMGYPYAPAMDVTGRQSPHYSQPQQLPPPQMGGMGSPLPPPNPLPYYTPLPPPNAQHITSSPMHAGMRYAMPVQQERIMSGGRHKKEIKRRTKTGCLTCRKRRIKCDEGHPTCKNCQKSKRECMGYDPIFKSQQQQGQPAIQPAQMGAQQQQQQQPPMPPTSMAFGVPQQVAPVQYVQSLSTAGNSPASSVEPYEYSIDPALEAVPVSTQAGHPGMMAEAQPVYRDLKRTYDRISPFSGVDPMLNAQLMGNPAARSPPYLEDPTLMGANAKRIKIDDLLSAHRGNSVDLRRGLGMAHLPTPPTTDPNVPMDTRMLYQTEYAPSFDELLETKWFSTKGQEKMDAEGSFYEAVSSLFTKLRLRGGAYLDESDPTLKQDEDTEVFWRSMELIFGIKAEKEQQANGSAEKEDKEVDIETQQTLMKLQVVHALLTRQTATIPRVKSPKLSPGVNGETTLEEVSDEFWECLRTFVGTPLVMSEMHECNKMLMNMHNRLTNQDVTRHILASIAEEAFLSKRLELEGNNAGSQAIRERVVLIRQYIDGIARAPPQNYNGIIRRICGRTVGLWSEPVETSIAV